MRFIGQAVMNNARPSQPLKTGQTGSYAGGNYDDGFYEMGIAKAYSVLTTGQYSGTTAIVLNGKTDNHSNNCVLDLATGLMWIRYVSASVGPASDGKLPFTTNGNGEGIYPYCEAAKAANLGGHNDWRVPNREEAAGIWGTASGKSAPNPTAFPSWPYDTAWTSSSTVYDGSSGVYISYGEILLYAIAKTNTYYTSLVRGGRS